MSRMTYTMTPDGPAAFTVQADNVLAGRVFHSHSEGWGWKMEWSNNGSTLLTTEQVLARSTKGGKTDGRGLKSPQAAFQGLKAALWEHN